MAKALMVQSLLVCSLGTLWMPSVESFQIPQFLQSMFNIESSWSPANADYDYRIEPSWMPAETTDLDRKHTEPSWTPTETTDYVNQGLEPARKADRQLRIPFPNSDGGQAYRYSGYGDDDEHQVAYHDVEHDADDKDRFFLDAVGPAVAALSIKKIIGFGIAGVVLLPLAVLAFLAKGIKLDVEHEGAGFAGIGIGPGLLWEKKYTTVTVTSYSTLPASVLTSCTSTQTIALATVSSCTATSCTSTLSQCTATSCTSTISQCTASATPVTVSSCTATSCTSTSTQCTATSTACTSTISQCTATSCTATVSQCTSTCCVCKGGNDPNSSANSGATKTCSECSGTSICGASRRRMYLEKLLDKGSPNLPIMPTLSFVDIASLHASTVALN